MRVLCWVEKSIKESRRLRRWEDVAGRTKAWRHSVTQGKWCETHSRVGDWDQHSVITVGQGHGNGQKDKPRPRHDQAGGRDGILQMGGWEVWGN